MKTHITISSDGHVVSDAKAFEWAKSQIGNEVTIGSETMLNAFRLLRVRGEIDELKVTFSNGETRTTNKLATMNDWPNDPVLDANVDMVTEIIGWGTKRLNS